MLIQRYCPTAAFPQLLVALLHPERSLSFLTGAADSQAKADPIAPSSIHHRACQCSSSLRTFLTRPQALSNVKQPASAAGNSLSPTKPLYSKSSEPSSEEVAGQQRTQQHQDLHLSQKKKWSLLLIFSLALFIDQWCLAAFYIFTTPIVDQLNVPFSQQSWVITSYAVTFAASLLFWGRLSDLYSAKQVFCYGFFCLGVISIIISFLPEKYSFFIFRAISGIAGGTSVPSAFRLIAGLFEPHELKKAFTLYGMAGAIAATTGNIVAGLLQLIQPTGQMAGWRWFFRLMAVLIIPVSIGSLKWVPKIKGHDADVKNKRERLDLVGSLSMLVAIVCLILALTLGATNGWGSAGFIAPLIISFLLFPFFFWHESRLPTTHALLPPHFWRYPNFTLWIVFALLIQGWFAVEQLPWIETFISVKGESSLKASVRILPQPFMAITVTILAAQFPQMTARPRITVALGLGCAIGANLLFIYAKDYTGMGYWKYVLPGYMIGAGSCMALFNMNNVGVMTTVPPESAGVAGALIQVSVQLGNTIALGIQAGLFTVFPDGIYNFKNVQTSWWFELGWCGVWLIMFLVFYRNPKKREDGEGDEEKGSGERVVMGH